MKIIVNIRKIKKSDINELENIIEKLSAWFNEDARSRAMTIDLSHQIGFVALFEEKIVGFITLYIAEGRLNIGWLGVVPNYHRKGIGSRLLSYAEEYGRKHGLKEIATYTLGESVDYKPYELTRKFYFKKGFKIYQRNSTDNPECQEEIKIKKNLSLTP